MFGRMACKHMHCISRACRAKGLVRIHDDLAASLVVRERSCGLGRCQDSICSDEANLSSLTDASLEKGRSGLGAILYNSQGLMVNWFSEEVPEDVVSPLNVGR